MSKDYRQQLVRSLEISLASDLDANTIQTVTRKLITVISNYEVTKRCTDVVVYDDANEKLIKKYLACMMVDGKSPKSIKGYGRCIKRFNEFIHKSLKDVTSYDVRYYLATEKERGNSNVTVENTRSYIRAFYQWMTDEEIISKNPCAVIKPIKCPEVQKLPFSDIEMDALRCACKTLKERAIVEMLASSGVRVAELSSMNVSDINFYDKTVYVRNGKGGKDRITYINDVAKLHIQKYLQSRTDDCIALFCNKKKGRLMTSGIRFILRELGKRAGVKNVHPHLFRRTLATNLAKRGMAVQEVQKMLGHTNIETTMIYVSTDNTKVQASYRQHIA